MYRHNLNFGNLRYKKSNKKSCYISRTVPSIFHATSLSKKNSDVSDMHTQWICVYLSRLFLKRGMLATTHIKFYKVILASVQALSFSIHIKNEASLAPDAQEYSLPVFFNQAFFIAPRQTSLNELIPLSTTYMSTHVSWASFSLASLWGWQHGLNVNIGLTIEKNPSSPYMLFDWIANALTLTYRIRYHALDRKVRKIVKNRYRFVRTYVCVRTWHRTRLGLRLLAPAVPLYGGLRWETRVGLAIESLIWEPENSLLRQLRRQHQSITLSVLGLV